MAALATNLGTVILVGCLVPVLSYGIESYHQKRQPVSAERKKWRKPSKALVDLPRKSSVKTPEHDGKKFKQWLLTPKKDKFSANIKESSLRAPGRWKFFKKPSPFFPARPPISSATAHTGSNGNIKKPETNIIVPSTAPRRKSILKPTPPSRKVGLTLEQIDSIYDRLIKYLTEWFALTDQEFDPMHPTIRDLEWAVLMKQEPLIDWKLYLARREVRDAQGPIKKTGLPARPTPTDPTHLSRWQIEALCRHDWSKGSVEDVYAAIARYTDHANLSSGFLTELSLKHSIRPKTDWEAFLTSHLGPLKNSNEDTSRLKNAAGKPIDRLGNEIRRGQIKFVYNPQAEIGDIDRLSDESPETETEIELTMRGALPSGDTAPRYNSTKFPNATLEDDTYLVGSEFDYNGEVQVWRLIRGTKLPHKLLWDDKRSYYHHDLSKPFKDALQKLKPPIRLDEYWISKSALMYVIWLKTQEIARSPEYQMLSTTLFARLTPQSGARLIEMNKMLDRYTIGNLIRFGGRIPAVQEAMEIGRLYGMRDAKYAEDLMPLKRYVRIEEWSQEEKDYWNALWHQADMYWESIKKLLAASEIHYETAVPETTRSEAATAEPPGTGMAAEEAEEAPGSADVT